MNDVVSRLRASKERFESESHSNGLQAGSEWAKNRAEAIELERLQSLRDETLRYAEWYQLFDPDLISLGGGTLPEYWVAYAISPEIDGDSRAADDFWKDELGVSERAPQWVRGFVEGALDVWGKVKSQI